MKEVNLTVRIYDKPHNILLSFTEEQKICIGKECTYAFMLVGMQNISRRIPKNTMLAASVEQPGRLGSRG